MFVISEGVFIMFTNCVSVAKLSNKVKRARQNAKLKRVLNPKNALTFLNELRPGGVVKFNVREETGWGFVASVDVSIVIERFISLINKN